jgi:hypothetical protein
MSRFRFRSKVDWRESAAHILLLSKFKGAREEYREGWLGGHAWEEWETALNESPQKAMRRLLDDGVLEQASLTECLAYKFKASDFKAMLRQRGLRVSGRKADLIDRLIQADCEGMQQAVSDLTLFKCSEQGREIVEQCKGAEREKRASLERTVLGSLQDRNFRKAVDLYVSYEAEQVFPKGMGIDWQDYPFSSEDVSKLSIIFEQRPKVLAQLSGEQLEPLRLAAGMFVLGWNIGQVSDWLPSDLETGLQMSNAAAAMQLYSYAVSLREIQEARVIEKEGFFRYIVEVRTCNDDIVCMACRELASKAYSLDDVPELPHEKCTSEDGCRCWLSVTPLVP